MNAGKTAALRHMQPELQDYVAAHQDFYPKAAQVLSGTAMHGPLLTEIKLARSAS